MVSYWKNELNAVINWYIPGDPEKSIPTRSTHENFLKKYQDTEIYTCTKWRNIKTPNFAHALSEKTVRASAATQMMGFKVGRTW